MEVVFSYHYSNILIFLIGMVIIIYLLSRYSAKKRAIRFGNFEILERVAGRRILSFSMIPTLLRILALSLVIIAISDPVLIYSKPSLNSDYVIALDTSSSMLTPDFKPNRLEAAKEAALDFIAELKPERVGIVTFSGKAYVKSELSSDHLQLEKIIKAISIEPPAGTAIGDALISAASLMQNSPRNRTIILITDGRNNVGIPLNQTLETLKKNGIRVFAIGIGSKEALNYTIPQAQELNATVAEFPLLDEESLKFIANQTKGMYFRAENRSVLTDAFRASLSYEEVRMGLSLYLLLAACLVLLVEWGLEITKYRIIP